MEQTVTKNVIEDLIETLEDGRKGFEQAADRLADDGHASLASRMREFSTQRASFSGELRNLASANSLEISEEGSVGGAMHRGWISLKDALTGDSPGAVLEAVKTGEDHAVEEYDEALDKELDGELLNVIRSQANVVRSARDEVYALTLD